MADLFSFLDGAPVDEDEDVEMSVNVPESSSAPRKRKDAPIAPATVEEEPSGKKQRLEEPEHPEVLDDFETEAKREVAASAGLQGSVEEGAKLELRHQVRDDY